MVTRRAPRASRSVPPALRGKTIAFIGAGNMGQALIGGLIATGVW